MSFRGLLSSTEKKSINGVKSLAPLMAVHVTDEWHIVGCQKRNKTDFIGDQHFHPADENQSRAIFNSDELDEVNSIVIHFFI